MVVVIISPVNAKATVSARGTMRKRIRIRCCQVARKRRGRRHVGGDGVVVRGMEGRGRRRGSAYNTLLNKAKAAVVPPVDDDAVETGRRHSSGRMAVIIVHATGTTTTDGRRWRWADHGKRR